MTAGAACCRTFPERFEKEEKLVLSKRILTVVAVLLLAPVGGLAGGEKPAEPPRKIFAHFMGCYSAIAGAAPHHRMNNAHQVDHTGDGKFDPIGDRWRNWPLAPYGLKVGWEESAKLDIRRALRAGIDGFAVDAWAGNESPDVLDALITVAEREDYPFEVTICLDPWCLPGGDKVSASADAINRVLDKHADSPKLARRDGRPLIFGYSSPSIGWLYARWKWAERPEWKGKKIGEVQSSKGLRCTPEGWKLMAEAHEKIEEKVGRDLYFHYGIGAFYHRVPHRFREKDMKVRAAGFMAQRFDAIGEFLGRGPLYDRMAKAVREAGAEWSQPLFFQYENINWGGNRISRGGDILRQCWEQARRNESTLIQFVTWNDYTENTMLAPGYDTRYTIMELNRYYVDWWKNGEPPQTDRDRMYLMHQEYPQGAPMFPFKRKQRDSEKALEVCTWLTEPATVRLPDRDVEYAAPAGMSHRQFPLEVGPVVAELVRDGEVLHRLESPEPVTDLPYRPQNSLVCISTEFERHWKTDFPDAEPYLHSEYGDDDGDGLPNWFEMYWFGKFLDHSTATVADPDADPDEDGKTNLEEYRAQADPTRKP